MVKDMYIDTLSLRNQVPAKFDGMPVKITTDTFILHI